MARLTKTGARKPVVDNGAICARTTVDWVPSEKPGDLRREAIIVVDLHDPATRKDHRLEMNFSEALQVLSQLAEQIADAGKNGIR